MDVNKENNKGKKCSLDDILPTECTIEDIHLMNTKPELNLDLKVILDKFNSQS